jgi:hypothetical protein
MAIAFFQHAFIAKPAQAQKYTAVANFRYITRKSATHHVLYGNLPFGYHPQAVQRWLTDHEDNLRKNGRVCDKFIIALPKEMSVEQSERLIRSYMNEISQHKAPWIATFQDWDTHNPHCHIIYVDRSNEDGKRVFQTTERGATERLKAIWEETTNAHLEAHQIDAQIQFGPKQSLELSSDGHLIRCEDNLIRYEDLPQPNHDPYYDEPLRPVTPLDIDEEDDEIDGEERPMTVLERTRTALSYHRELSTLRDARQRLSDLQLASEEARTRLEAATQVATLRESQALEASYRAEDLTKRYHGLVKEDGTHKGFAVKLFGKTLYTSPTRKEAVATQEASGQASYDAMIASAEARSAAEAKAMQEVLAHTFQEQAERVGLFVRTYGEEHELDKAEADMEGARAYALDGVTLMDLQLAYEAGEIRADEYEEALRMLGHADLAEEFSDSQEVDPF